MRTVRAVRAASVPRLKQATSRSHDSDDPIALSAAAPSAGSRKTCETCSTVNRSRRLLAGAGSNASTSTRSPSVSGAHFSAAVPATHGPWTCASPAPRRRNWMFSPPSRARMPKRRAFAPLDVIVKRASAPPDSSGVHVSSCDSRKFPRPGGALAATPARKALSLTPAILFAWDSFQPADATAVTGPDQGARKPDCSGCGTFGIAAPGAGGAAHTERLVAACHKTTSSKAVVRAHRIIVVFPLPGKSYIATDLPPSCGAAWPPESEQTCLARERGRNETAAVELRCVAVEP